MWSFERFVEETQRAAGVAELKSLFEAALAEDGYQNHAMATLIDSQTLGAVHWVQFPRGYFETYLAERWERIDPLSGPAMRARHPFFWEEVIRGADLPREQAAFMQDIKELGVQAGLIFPMLGAGGQCTHISISKREASPQDARRVPILRAICTQAWVRYLDLAEGPTSTALTRPWLTAREREILNWIKDGKSNAEISQILNVSIKTVEYHASNILRKLGASNRITAVVKALQIGLLTL